MQNSKNVQEPQNDENHHHGIQDRLDGSGHRNKAIDEPEKYTHHDENFEELNQRHDLFPFVLRGLAPLSAGRLPAFRCSESIRPKRARRRFAACTRLRMLKLDVAAAKTRTRFDPRPPKKRAANQRSRLRQHTQENLE